MFSLTGWSPPVPEEVLVLRGTQVPPRRRVRFRVRGCHPLRPGFPSCSATFPACLCRRSYNPARCRDTRGLGSCAFARHYWRNHCYFLFLRVLRCFSSPRSLCITRCSDGIAPAGFPHSDIRGSRSICLSPRLFAAYHVLRRLREPQASPVRPSLLSFVFRLYLTLLLQVRSILDFSMNRFTLSVIQVLRFQHVNDLFQILWRITDSNR